VGTALAEVGAVSVLGVQRVSGEDRTGQVDAVQQGAEGGDLVALVGDLALGQVVAGVVHRGEQGDVPGDVGALGAANVSEAEQLHSQHRPLFDLAASDSTARRTLGRAR
jgi:hypothetical protein